MKAKFPEAVYLDLLEAQIYNKLLADPQRLSSFIPNGFKGWVILDEVQKVPALLEEVHRLIENQRLKFILTGSSARKLRHKGTNLLAGRALTCHLYPLTAAELGADFDLERSLRFGQLPCAYTDADPKRYLESYVQTYLREEVMQEGITRNLGAFTRFLEAASFSQGNALNISAVARDAGIERKVVENYFTILEDMLIAHRLPVFTKRAKRRIVAHPKFYFFDTGVFRVLRPMGPLDKSEEAEGAACETLLFQELLATNDYHGLGYSLHYWRTSQDAEVDFVLYGPRGIRAFEVKRASRLDRSDFSGLRAFLGEYPMAKVWMVYGGDRRMREGEIDVIPMEDCIKALVQLLE